MACSAVSGRARLRSVAASLTLVACGIVGAAGWSRGMWGLVAGAGLVALWLCATGRSVAVRPRIVARDPAAGRDGGDDSGLRLLLDAAPTPLVGIGDGGARALNRAARHLFATDDRLLPPPVGLTDPGATHLHHEGRNWRIDRVAIAGGHGVAALIDIEREERAAEARATAELVQVLGHELLNGLAPIVSLAESGAAAVARADVDLALLREILGTLTRRAEGLCRFTEAYRSFARLPEPVRRPVRLREMAGDLARLFGGRWPGLPLSVAVDDGVTWRIDRDQISQAVWALLQNAAEAVDPGDGRVVLRMRPAGDGLSIEVEDNGIGVPADDVRRIFRPFHTGKPGGTGVGLSLARQIALAHGGDLTLDMRDRTVFRIALPA